MPQVCPWRQFNDLRTQINNMRNSCDMDELFYPGEEIVTGR